jgi:prepilin peptidase CpaA
MLQEMVATSPFVSGPAALAFGGVFSAMLAVACVTDVRSRRIPTRIVGWLAFFGLAFSIVSKGLLWGGLSSVAGLVTGFAIWIGFYALGVLGAGDVKLAASVGAWLGAAGVLKASLVAAVAGGILAVLTLLLERRAKDAFERILVVLSTRSLVPLGAPTTAESGGVGSAAAVVRRPMPYGVALATGALIVGWVPALIWW